MRRDSSFCAKSVRYNIFTNGAPYKHSKQCMLTICPQIAFITSQTKEK